MLNLMHLYQMSVVQGKQHQGHLWSHLMGGSPNGLELEHQWESSPGWHKGHKPLGGSCWCPPPVLGGTAWKKSWKIVPPIPRFVGQAEVKCKEQHRECHPLIPTSSMASPGWLVMGSHWGKEGYSLLYPLREGLCGYHKVIADAH